MAPRTRRSVAKGRLTHGLRDEEVEAHGQQQNTQPRVEGIQKSVVKQGKLF